MAPFTCDFSLTDVDSETLKNGVENTSRLPGGDHVGEKIVEGFWVLPHGVRKSGTALYIHPRLLEYPREGLVLLLAA